MASIGSAVGGRCDLAQLREQHRQLSDVRRDLAAQVRQPSPSKVPTIATAAVGGTLGAVIGGSMRTYGGGHGGPLGNIAMGLGLGAMAGSVLGFLAFTKHEHVDPAQANPDIAVLDARIAGMSQQIVDCAVVGS